MLRRSILVVLFVLFGNLADAGAQAMRDATRGELLYSTHCIACHSAQVHWRDRKLATDWISLQAAGLTGRYWNADRPDAPTLVA